MVPTMYLVFVNNLYQGIFEDEENNGNHVPKTDADNDKLVVYVLAFNNGIQDSERKIEGMDDDV